MDVDAPSKQAGLNQQESAIASGSGSAPVVQSTPAKDATVASMDIDLPSSTVSVNAQVAESSSTGPGKRTPTTTSNGLPTSSTSAESTTHTSIPQTVNTADIFSIPPPPSDTASEDVSMSESGHASQAIAQAQTIPQSQTQAQAPTQTQTQPEPLSAPVALSTVTAPPPHAQSQMIPSASPNTASSSQVVSIPPRMSRTGYIYDPMMMLHCPDGYTPTSDSAYIGDNHPEEPMRIKRIFVRLAEHGLIQRMKKLDFQEVTFEQVMLVHSEGHWDKVQGTECELLS